MKILSLFISILVLLGCQPAEVDTSTDSLSVTHPSSEEVISQAKSLAASVPVATTELGENIYGKAIPQGRNVSDEAFPYRWQSDQNAHDFKIRDSGELAKTRYGEAWMAYRKYWAAQDGWEDHVFDASICLDHAVDAAMLPQSPEAWRAEGARVGIRYFFPDTEEGIAEGLRRLRESAQRCFEFALKIGAEKSLRVELHLDLYTPSSFPSDEELPIQ